MISYADFDLMAGKRAAAMRDGLHAALHFPPRISLFLDNGAFTFCRHEREAPVEEFCDFVAQARPDWFPIPSDSIPVPSMTSDEQRGCFRATMAMNRRYAGFEMPHVPVVHIGSMLPSYLRSIRSTPQLRALPHLAVGGIVPNLLRTGRAQPHLETLKALRDIRRAFSQSHLHIFGIGGTSTVHLAALLGFNSADSSGWRNRAARGLIQLPGTGDRMVADLGSWHGRLLSNEEWEILRECPCPACRHHGPDNIGAGATQGFAHRATHNLWVLLEEERWVREHLAAGTYEQEFRARLDNTIYLPLIERALQMREEEVARERRRLRRLTTRNAVPNTLG